jgi:hypothetical protein
MILFTNITQSLLEIYFLYTDTHVQMIGLGLGLVGLGLGLLGLG